MLPEGWTLHSVAVEDHKSFADATRALLDLKPGVIVTAADREVYGIATLRALLRIALQRRVPVYGYSTQLVRAGALFGGVVDPASHARQAWELLAGWISPAKAPPQIHLPTQPESAVNLIVAERIGITLSEELVERSLNVFR